MLTNCLDKRALGMAALIALSAIAVATAQTTQSQSSTGQTSSQPATPMQSTDPQSTQTKPATSGSTLNAADQRMLKTMALNNMAEIEAARMAQTKTQSEDVKSFAQRMIDDHTKALDDVRQLAQAKGVSLPTELDRASKRKAAKLAALSGDAFNRAYMGQAGVADHKRSHALLVQAQSRAKDPDLQALAARTLPVVDQHLNSAQQLHKNTAMGSSGNRGKTGASSGKQD